MVGGEEAFSEGGGSRLGDGADVDAEAANAWPLRRLVGIAWFELPNELDHVV